LDTLPAMHLHVTMLGTVMLALADVGLNLDSKAANLIIVLP